MTHRSTALVFALFIALMGASIFEHYPAMLQSVSSQVIQAIGR